MIEETWMLPAEQKKINLEMRHRAIEAMPELEKIARRRIASSLPLFKIEEYEDEHWCLFYRGIGFYSSMGVESDDFKGVTPEHTHAEKIAIVLNNVLDNHKLKIKD